MLSNDPFLKIGIALASFNSSEYTPVDRDMLRILERGWLMSFLSKCKMFVEILFGPVAFLGLSEFIIFPIYMWSHSKITKVSLN